MNNYYFVRRKKGVAKDNSADGQTRKYGNKKVIYDGIKFDSEKEGKRYLFLKQKEQEGVITDLQCHPKWELIPKVGHIEYVQLKTKVKQKLVCDQLPITYSADFIYKKDGLDVIEDIKPSPSMPLPKEFQLKVKLLFWRYRLRVRIVYKATDAV